MFYPSLDTYKDHNFHLRMPESLPVKLPKAEVELLTEPLPVAMQRSSCHESESGFKSKSAPALLDEAHCGSVASAPT